MSILMMKQMKKTVDVVVNNNSSTSSSPQSQKKDADNESAKSFQEFKDSTFMKIWDEIFGKWWF